MRAFGSEGAIRAQPVRGRRQQPASLEAHRYLGRRGDHRADDGDQGCRPLDGRDVPDLRPQSAGYPARARPGRACRPARLPWPGRSPASETLRAVSPRPGNPIAPWRCGISGAISTEKFKGKSQHARRRLPLRRIRTDPVGATAPETRETRRASPQDLRCAADPGAQRRTAGAARRADRALVARHVRDRHESDEHHRRVAEGHRPRRDSDGFEIRLSVLPAGHRRTGYSGTDVCELPRGQSARGRTFAGSMARARDLFAVCVAQDPTFAAAWAWLGRCARFLEKFTAGSAANLDLADAAFRRALAIDPHLACAHHFYTQLQIDLGQSAAAAARLVDRILSRGDEPESYAGLVHALRFCGLLAQSVAAQTAPSRSIRQS